MTGDPPKAPPPRYRLSRRVYDAIERANPLTIAFVIGGIAMLLLLASFALGINDVEHRGKQVGYVAAINWSVVYIGPAPIAAMLLAGLPRAIRELMDDLARRGMLLAKQPDGGTVVMTREEAAAAWESEVRALPRWWLWFALVFGLGVAMFEFGTGAAVALMNGNCDAPEADWSFALCNAELPERVGNLVFSFSASMLQATYVALLWLLVMLVKSLCGMFFLRGHIVLQPNLRDGDRRMGFQVFGPVLTRILWAVIFAYLSVYLSRLWNVHLNSGNDGNAVDTLVAGIPESLGQVAADNLSAVALLSGMATLLLTCLAVPFLLLRRAAERARTAALEHAIGRGQQLLASMPVWPLDYPRQNILLSLVLLGGLSIFFFRLGIVFVACAAVLLGWQLFETSPVAPADKAKRGPVPWWLVSVLVGAATFAVLLVVTYLPAPWSWIVPVSTVAAIVVYLVFDPKRFYRRLAWTSVGLAAGGFTVKAFGISLAIETAGGGEIVFDVPTPVGVALVLFAVAALILDPSRSQENQRPDDDDAGTTPDQTADERPDAVSWNEVTGWLDSSVVAKRHHGLQAIANAIERKQRVPPNVVRVLEALLWREETPDAERARALELMRWFGLDVDAVRRLVKMWCAATSRGDTRFWPRTDAPGALYAVVTDSPATLVWVCDVLELQQTVWEVVARDAMIAARMHLQNRAGDVPDDVAHRCAALARRFSTRPNCFEVCRDVIRQVTGAELAQLPVSAPLPVVNATAPVPTVTTAVPAPAVNTFVIAPVAVPAPAESRDVHVSEHVDELIRVLLAAGLVNHDWIDGVLAALPPEYAATLPRASAPRARLEQTFGQLRHAGPLLGGERPMTLVLKRLTHEPLQDVVDAARLLLGTARAG